MLIDGVEVLGTLAEKVDPAHTALLIIDMCNDFIDPEGKTAVIGNRPLDHARSIVGTQQLLLQAARRARVTVVFVQHTTLPGHGSDSGPWLDARQRATFSVPDLCMDGTWGQQIIRELEPQAGEYVVKKYRYSGFPGTNLGLLLRSHGIRTVITSGVSTNVCVEATAREAFSLDYYVVYPSDACASWNRELHDSTLKTAAHRYAVVADTAEIIGVWSTSSA